MDTDSFVYSTSTNVYAEMNRCSDGSTRLAFLPVTRSTSRHATKVLGLFKDECGNDPMIQFVGLRPKMYSFLTRSQSTVSRAKGVQRSVVKKYKFQNYLDCLFQNSSRIDKQCCLRSKHHINYSFVQNKRSLRVADDQTLLDRYVNEFAMGPFRIQCTRRPFLPQRARSCLQAGSFM